MNENRLAEFWQREGNRVGTNDRQGAFAACPAVLLSAPWQQQLYQAAYDRACAVAAPWPPRRLECWN